MAPKELPYQLFDADNHLYETEEALTKFLPDKYKDAIKYVQVDGRTKIAIRGQISDYIPNPHLRGGRAAGRDGGLLQERQSRGQEQAGDLRQVDEVDPGVPRAGRAPGADGRTPDRAHPDVPDAREPRRGAHA